MGILQDGSAAPGPHGRAVDKSMHCHGVPIPVRALKPIVTADDTGLGNMACMATAFVPGWAPAKGQVAQPPSRRFLPRDAPGPQGRRGRLRIRRIFGGGPMGAAAGGGGTGSLKGKRRLRRGRRISRWGIAGPGPGEMGARGALAQPPPPLMTGCEPVSTTGTYRQAGAGDDRRECDADESVAGGDLGI